MIVVNDPGDAEHTYQPLRHAEWDQITPTDLVFPFFLFIVGVALAAALRPYLVATPSGPSGERRRPDRSLYLTLARRALVLVGLGLFINGFPDFDFETWRIPGVLQRIGICFFAAALLVIHLSFRWQLVIGGAILVAYAVVLRFVAAPGVSAGQLEPWANLPRWVDLAVFSEAHVFMYWPTEPEGILSTPAAVVSVLLGAWIGIHLVERPATYRRASLVILAGIAVVTMGWLWSSTLPMVKMIWTPSYVLFAGGLAMVCFGLAYMLTDVRPMPKWLWVLQVFGRNAILGYVLAGLTAVVLSRIPVDGKPFPLFVATSFTEIGRGFVSAEMGSLAYACGFTFAVWMALYVLYRRRWFVRI